MPSCWRDESGITLTMGQHTDQSTSKAKTFLPAMSNLACIGGQGTAIMARQVAMHDDGAVDQRVECAHFVEQLTIAVQDGVKIQSGG
jgi:hypothetical protein